MNFFQGYRTNSGITKEEINIIQKLIEKGLRLYMNKEEIMTALEQQANVKPEYTSLGTKNGIEKIYDSLSLEKNGRNPPFFLQKIFHSFTDQRSN